MSNKPAVSKAGPLSKDLKSILVYNLVAIHSMAGFAALGLSVAAAAAGARPASGGGGRTPPPAGAGPAGAAAPPRGAAPAGGGGPPPPPDPHDLRRARLDTDRVGRGVVCSRELSHW